MDNQDRNKATCQSFFGLKETPFDNTPDPRFLYLSNKHREALAQLIYGVQERKGFVVLSGEARTGKTMIVKALLERLGENCMVAYLLDPKPPITAFLGQVCHSFDLQVKGRSKIDYLTKLHDFLLGAHQHNKTTILIVDDAQNLDASLFEEIRMLTNLETSSQKLLQIFLVGGPELDQLLDQSELRQLKQRISTRYRLPPLDCQETNEYIQARMRIAGARNLNCFTEGAIQEIYTHSRGLPGLINSICDKSLWLGYTKNTRFIDERTVQKCVIDLGLDRVPQDTQALGEKREIRIAGHSFAYTPLILILILWALVVTGVGLFLQNRKYPAADRPVQAASSQGIPPVEVVSQQSDYGESTMAEGERTDYSLQPETNQPMGTPVPEVDQMGDSETLEVGANTEGADSTPLDEPGAGELPVMIAKRGGGVGTEVTGESDRIKSQAPEVVQELSTEAGDASETDVGQVARLPEAEGQIALSKEKKEQKKAEDTLPQAGTSFRTEEEILIELGEIEGPQKKSQNGESIEVPFANRSGKSTEERGLEPLSTETEERVAEEVRETSDDELVPILDDLGVESDVGLESQSETGKERPPGEELKEAEDELASLGTEKTRESIDVNAMEVAVESSREDRREGVLEKQPKGGASLIAAEEEEVKQFFAQYVQRYSQRDLDGFLSLFSDKAVQNGKDGIDGIRKMYSSFFDQSKELQYRLENTRIQIYQNAVEAKARYEVDQILRKGKKRKVWKGEVRWILVREDGTLRVVSLDYKQR